MKGPSGRAHIVLDGGDRCGGGKRRRPAARGPGRRGRTSEAEVFWTSSCTQDSQDAACGASSSSISDTTKASRPPSAGDELPAALPRRPAKSLAHHRQEQARPWSAPSSAPPSPRTTLAPPRPVARGRRSAAAKLPKLAGFLDEAKTGVLATLTFPAAHRLAALDQLPGAAQWPGSTFGPRSSSIFPNEAAIVDWSAPILSNRTMNGLLPEGALHDPGIH